MISPNFLSISSCKKIVPFHVNKAVTTLKKKSVVLNIQRVLVRFSGPNLSEQLNIMQYQMQRDVCVQ